MKNILLPKLNSLWDSFLNLLWKKVPTSIKTGKKLLIFNFEFSIYNQKQKNEHQLQKINY